MIDCEQIATRCGLHLPHYSRIQVRQLNSPLIFAAFGSQISADLRESASRQSAEISG